MTLAETIRAQRAQKIARQMASDTLHGRSYFPALEADGADAHRHGYPVDACPYANAAQLDRWGYIVPTSEAEIRKAAAWRRGWALAAAVPA